jgi:hypothetical protein
MLVDAGDPGLDALRAEVLGEAAQVARIGARIQVIGVAEAVVLQVAEAVLARRQMLEAIVAILAGQAALAALHPEMLEAGGPVVDAGQAERVDIVLAGRAPVLEADAQFEGRLGCPHEVGFVHLQQLVKPDQAGNGRFAHPDGTDLVGFDQRDVECLAQDLGDDCGCHPAGCAAAGDDNAPHRLPADFFRVVLLHGVSPATVLVFE